MSERLIIFPMSNVTKDFLYFIHDDFQSELKSKSKDKRFEKTLENYKNNFFDEFENLISCHKLNLLKDTGLKDVKSLYNNIDKIYNEFKKYISEYKSFFDSIIYTYKLFISGKRYFATLHLNNTLEENGLDDTIDLAEIGLFYRGRFINDKDDFRQKNFYYHIPFNERYKTKNERFSFSGQPILYLGSSILDILFELHKSQDDFKQMAISAFTYLPSKDKKPLRVFDLTNVISKKLFETYFYLHSEKDLLNSIVDNFQLSASFDYKKDFKIYILMQLCTFPRNNNNNFFIEEYVLAQVLTEALSIKGYDGVKYPSTQFLDKSIKQPLFYSSLIQENLCLFAKYSYKSLHDYELLNRFNIEILSDNNIKDCSKSNVKKLCDKLSIDSISIFKNTNIFLKAATRIENTIKCKELININNNNFYNSFIDKAELYAQFIYLQNLIKELNGANANNANK